MRYGDRPTSYVCFDCRRYRSSKMFSACKCPECRQPMVDMGITWQPPKRDDIEAWDASRQSVLEQRDTQEETRVSHARFKDYDLVRRVSAEKKSK